MPVDVEDLQKTAGLLGSMDLTIKADNVDAAIAEISALRAAAGGANVGVGWQPMETARRDFQPVLLALDSGKHGDISRAPVVAAWHPGRGGWMVWDSAMPVSATPVRWQPLPDPPSDVGVNVGVNQYGETHNGTTSTP